MNSSTSSSKPPRETQRRLLGLYLLTLVTFVGMFLLLELGVRYYGSKQGMAPEDIQTLMARLPHMHISGRETAHQMLVHNVALFKRYPTPSSVTTGYVGTSRTKVLRPEHFGLSSAVVGAGNSYNEMSYGLLLQGEILRLRFPQLKRVYFETSMLLRRPARLILEEDHRKYLPLLQSLAPLCMQLPAEVRCTRVFESLIAKKAGAGQWWHSQLLTKRSKLRFAALLAEEKKDILVMDDPFLKSLKPNGERKHLPEATARADGRAQEITNDNIKVQHLRDTLNNAPWDGLFDLIALWGRAYNIEVIFFQPPVRSDLYRFQVQYGLSQHVADLQRVSREYRIPYIDLNQPELGYMNDWTLFSDEDHMETCVGSGLLTLALDAGNKTYRAENELFPRVGRNRLQAAERNKLRICGEV